MKKIHLLAAACLWTGSYCQEESMDLILHNGTVYTLDPALPKAEAIRIRNGVVAELGSNRAAASWKGERIDLRGATAVPGWVDAHGHVMSLGGLLRQLDLRDAKSYDEVIERVRERAARTPAGTWILGRGWNQEHWSPPVLPTHDRLSAAVPDHPVWLRRVDGHAGLANRKALEAAGITKETPNPPGGEILRDPRGDPTGVLVDNAMELLSAVLPESSAESLREAILSAQESLVRHGVTAVHDAGVSPEGIDLFLAMESAGLLKLRYYLMVAGDGATLRAYMRKHPLRIGQGDRMVTVRSLKIMADGALGSRGAMLLEPYEDRPKDDQGRPYYGLDTFDAATLRSVSIAALKAGWQVCVHAIGDRANRKVLDIFAAALEQVPVRDHRFRIEHAQIVHPDDIPRFAGLGVIPSMQPTHATSDMGMAEKRLGPRRLAGAYPWRKFYASGARIAGGSDFPVESENPLWGFYAAVTRQDHEGKPEGGWLPEERMTREEALRCFTTDACYAAFQEGWKGTLSPGMAADISVLSRDIMSVPPKEILAAETLYTIVNGKIVYRR